MSILQERLDEILRQKQQLLKPENIRQGVNVYGVEGQMTTENMWTPIYGNAGNYYILSFVAPDGNTSVKSIHGYDKYRFVTFNNDDRGYLYDVSGNKPIFLTSELPNDVNELVGYTDEYIYLGYFITDSKSAKIYKVNTEDYTFVTLNMVLPYYFISVSEYIDIKHFYTLLAAGTSGNNNTSYVYKYDLDTDKFVSVGSGVTSTSSYYADYSSISIINDYLMTFSSGGTVTTSSITDLSQYYKMPIIQLSSGIVKYGYGASSKLNGISPDALYAFTSGTNKGIYNYTFSTNTIGAKVADVPWTDNYISLICWINEIYFVRRGKLYMWDKDNLTVQYVTDINDYNVISSHYVDVPIGYEFLGKKNYYLLSNTGAKSDIVLENNSVFDGYNRPLEGTMPNHGYLTIDPKITDQEFPAGYYTGITAKMTTYAIDTDIKPENIRYGVDILGIGGSLEQDAAESVMSAEEYATCLSLANNILGTTEEEVTNNE